MCTTTLLFIFQWAWNYELNNTLQFFRKLENMFSWAISSILFTYFISICICVYSSLTINMVKSLTRHNTTTMSIFRLFCFKNTFLSQLFLTILSYKLMILLFYKVSGFLYALFCTSFLSLTPVHFFWIFYLFFFLLSALQAKVPAQMEALISALSSFSTIYCLVVDCSTTVDSVAFAYRAVINRSKHLKVYVRSKLILLLFSIK